MGGVEGIPHPDASGRDEASLATGRCSLVSGHWALVAKKRGRQNHAALQVPQIVDPNMTAWVFR